jgi:hypothetical protein
VVSHLHLIWEIGHIAICPFICMAMHRLWERRQHRKQSADILAAPTSFHDFGDVIERFGPKEQYYVHSADGTDYKVGAWAHGTWLPGTVNDAYRELALLNERDAYVWGESL